MPALLLLVATALLVVFWLPERLMEAPSQAAQPPPPQVADEPSPAGNIAGSTERAAPAATQDATPWSDAQQARLRLAARTCWPNCSTCSSRWKNRA
ncbi:MAG: hypothetical protein R3228_08290 [Halioglobus sp.]|nr:hypothetical protein [Halioglobus sp.]